MRVQIAFAQATVARCRRWVNRVTLIARRSLPVFPELPTFAGFVGMSQTCQTRTSGRV
jgi:hypothetical protein